MVPFFWQVCDAVWQVFNRQSGDLASVKTITIMSKRGFSTIIFVLLAYGAFAQYGELWGHSSPNLATWAL